MAQPAETKAVESSTASRFGSLPADVRPIGRAEMVKRIHGEVKHHGGRVVIAGQGGLGKTTLARDYVKAHGDFFAGIIWVRAEDATTLADDLGELAAVLPSARLDQLPPEKKARALLNALPADQDWLIVYDNVQASKNLGSWWPTSERARVLVTSRAKQWESGVAVVEPDTLKTDTPSDPGPQLLMREADKRDDPEGARALAEELGGLPLALVAAGGLIRDTGGSFADYRDRLGAILSEVPAGDYPDSVIGAVKLSYDALDADARTVLELFAWCAPEGLDASLLTDVPCGHRIQGSEGVLSDDLQALCADPDRVAAATMALARRSLLLREGETFTLHRMSAAAVRALQGQAGRRDDAARQAAAVLAAAYPGGGERSPAFSKNWPACAPLTPHVLALHRAWPLAEADRLESAAADYLFNQASIYLRQMAEHGPALVLAEAALALKCARLPESHRDVALGWSTLGLAYKYSGRLADAVDVQAEAVRLHEEHEHGPAYLAKGHNNHAAALCALGQERADRALLEAAKVANETALALCREVFGAESAEVAGSLSNLALYHAALGETPDSLDLSRQALAIFRKVLPPGDALMGIALSNTGALHLTLGQADAARPLLTQALDLRRAAHVRDNHPKVRQMARWLVYCHLVLARRDPENEAEARRIAANFGLDWDEHQRLAAQFPGPVDVEADDTAPEAG